MATPTMNALVVTGPDEFSIQTVDKPSPGRGEVLCRVRAVSICGTDAHLIHGDYRGFWPPAYPFIPGHEWAGEVVELGDGAAAYGWSVGDRVAGTSHNACGFCQKCVEGHYNLCENYGNPSLHRQYGHNWQGAFAEFVVHGVKSMFHLPDELSFAQGALLDPASIALHTANVGAVRPSDTVVVLGPGPIGLLAADAARVRGAARVIMVGRGDRLAKAVERGSEPIDYDKESPVERVREMTSGLGADVVLDCAGVETSFQWGLDMLRKGGRLAAVGIPVEEVTLNLQQLVLYEKEILGVRASAGEMRHVIPLVVDGRIRVDDLHTHTFPLDQFDQALKIFNGRKDGALKLVIVP